MKKLDKIMKWGGNLEQTILSMVKIPLLSRKSTPLPKNGAEGESLVILANGPSLNSTVAEHRDFLEGKSLMAVNLCAVSPLFTQLRPQYYIIADPLFWIVDEKRETLFGSIAEKTDWPMTMFVPARALSDPKWRPILEKNPNVSIAIYNTTPVEGFPAFERWAFRKGFGMPRPHNVLIPAISVALRLPFKTIYLAGADHSWLPEISVTDDNEVLMHQKHFYDRNSSKADTVKKENLDSAHLHTILYHMHVAFKAYFILRDYAASLGKEIINITPGSFIDAFKREKL